MMRREPDQRLYKALWYPESRWQIYMLNIGQRVAYPYKPGFPSVTLMGAVAPGGV